MLIEGESGVGKELIARAIQGESERAGKPFVTVNCGAIPENLVESILFGHEKGSFTGAIDKRIGKFQEADGGTLFLDEVGELPLDAQVKLLRALQEGEIDPVGAKKPVKVNFRLISATNRDMIQLVKDGKFREDLYYRLNVFPIWVPPLRERLDDVPELAHHFLARFAAEEGKRVAGLTDDAMRLLTSYTWPGNVRQLENAVFRAVVLADGPELTVAEFPQIAAHVEGFKADDPGGAGRSAQAAGLHRTGPARRRGYRAADRRGRRHHRHAQLARHPGDRRGRRDPLARSDRGRHDPPGARPLSRPHDRGRQAPQASAARRSIARCRSTASSRGRIDDFSPRECCVARVGSACAGCGGTAARSRRAVPSHHHLFRLSQGHVTRLILESKPLTVQASPSNAKAPAASGAFVFQTSLHR